MLTPKEASDLKKLEAKKNNYIPLGNYTLSTFMKYNIIGMWNISNSALFSILS